MRSVRGWDVRRWRGLTVVDTLVLLVIAVCFVGLLMPMFSRVRAEAVSDTCASHLASIGKVMLIYANDYNDALPRAGGRNAYWTQVTWDAPDRRSAYGILNSDGTGGSATISSCFYLLVRYAETDPNVFVCGADPNVSEFTLAEEPNNPVPITELRQAWDFGSNPQTHCSYAYHSSWGAYALTTSNDPNMAVAADRNPYIASPGMKTPRTFFDPNDPAVFFMGKAGSEACQKYGNSAVHGGEGQNVLFLDTHVGFETRPYCSRDDDNIYTLSRFIDKGDSVGVMPKATITAVSASPTNRNDSVLVHDPPSLPVATFPLR